MKFLLTDFDVTNIDDCRVVNLSKINLKQQPEDNSSLYQMRKVQYIPSIPPDLQGNPKGLWIAHGAVNNLINWLYVIVYRDSKSDGDYIECVN